MSSSFGKTGMRALLIFVVSLSDATADIFNDLEVHGFATQGFIKTSDNSVFGDSESGSFDFRELGINASMQPLSNLRLAGQLLSRKAGELSDGSIDVDFALADVTLYGSESGSAGLMIGRIKNPLGLFNETRDVAFLRPSLNVPQVVYHEKLRNLFLSSDSIGLHADVFGERFNTSLYLAAGEPRVDDNVKRTFFAGDLDGDLEPDGLSFLGRALFESSDSRFKTALSLSKLSMDYKQGDTDPVPDGNINTSYGIASVQWSRDIFTLSAEYMRQPIEWKGFQRTFFDDLRTKAEGYYLQGAIRMTDEVELMVRYGEFFADRDDRSGKDFSTKTFGLVPAHSRYSKIFTAGIRWDVTRNLMLRAEYQRHNGTFVLSRKENPDPQDTDPDWDLFALEASYRF